MITCLKCNKEISPIEIFPGQICVDCWGKLSEEEKISSLEKMTALFQGLKITDFEKLSTIFPTLRPATINKIEAELNYDSEKAIEAFKKEYPRGVDLVYIDRSDELSDEQCQEVIKVGYSEVFDNEDWLYDSEWQSFVEICKELSTITEYEVDDLESDENLRDFVYNSNTSDPLKDLIRNTRNKAMFYELDLEIQSPDSTESIKESIEQIMEHLKLGKNKENEDLINELVINASYGGNLCVYWYGEISDLLPVEDPDFKYISWENPEICIMDRGNGSGYSVTYKGTIECDFKRKNLWLDKEAGGYSYGYDVCGLYMPSFENTARLSNIATDKNRNFVELKSEEQTKIEMNLEKEKEWDRKLKEEKICSHEDPRWHSHQFEYHNEPMMCRHQCKICGRVVMD